MENEEHATTANNSPPLFPSINQPETSTNTTIDTNDESQHKKEVTPYIIPESPSLPATETDSNVTEDIIQTDNIDNDSNGENEISSIDTQQKTIHNIDQPHASLSSNVTSFSSSSSNNNISSQDVEVKEQSSQNGNISYKDPETPTSTTTLSPPQSPSSSQLGKHHRETSLTKSTPAKEYPPTHVPSGSLSPSSAHLGKKVIRLSIPSPLTSSLATKSNSILSSSSSVSSISSAAAELVSPKATPPPTLPRSFRHLLPTGYIYDVFMSYHATLDTFDIHPEDPRRIFFIYREMMSQNLLERCQRIPIRKATKQEILAVHELDLLKALMKTRDMTRKELMDMENSNDSIYVNNHSYEASLYAAGGVMEICKAVLEDEIKNGFAIVRPPGHHAESDISMGFCFINNVAIATQYCLQQLKLKKIMIVDWDVHFGNGTHQIFASNPNVLYLSIHRYDNGGFYPGYDNGSIECVGEAPAQGRSVNIAWPNEGTTDSDYMYAFHQVVMPIGYEFQPDLLIVSAGFDAADGDYIGMCKVSPAGFSNMTYLLKGLANGRMVMALEGGYNLKSTSVSATACMSVLMGESPLPLKLRNPSKEAATTVDKVKVIQSKYWKSLR